MAYTCLTSSTAIPDPPAGFMETREFTDRLQGTPDQPAFAQGGTGYILVVNRPVTIEWQYLDDLTGDVVDNPWSYLKVQFAPDLDLDETIIAEQEFPKVDAGTVQERFTGSMPAEELNKLTIGQWYMARLIASDGHALAHCPFYVIGGVK